jgi:hypothetical protein
MKPWIAFAACLLLLGGAASAQNEIRQEVKRLDLTEAQMVDVVKVIHDAQGDLDKARADVQVSRAQLARLLLDDNPVRADLEKQVRQGLEGDFKVRMMRIDRSLKIRAIVGKDKWALLSSLSAKVVEAEKTGRRPLAPLAEDKGSARDFLEVIRDLN